jgi:hypothetical protein
LKEVKLKAAEAQNNQFLGRGLCVRESFYVTAEMLIKM